MRAEIKPMKLSEVRRSIVGDSDDYHYRSMSGRRISMPVGKRHKSVILCSENCRLGYRGVSVINRTEDGWEEDTDQSFLDQSDRPQSFTALIDGILGNT